MNRWLWVLLILVVVAVGVGGLIFRELSSLTVSHLSDDLYLVSGVGGNAAILKTSEGAVIVDTMLLTYQGERLKETAERLTGKPVVMIINTHYHLDHTRGNPAFDVGTRVIATSRTLHHLQVTDAEYFEGFENLMPNETFKETRRITIGDKNLTLIHPGRGHTDGDLVVLFEEESVLHAGDLFFNRLYPSIDHEGGGSVYAWIDTLDAVLALPFEQVIPGHGVLSDKAGLQQFRRFLTQAGQLGKQAAASGMALEEFLNTPDLSEDAGYGEIEIVIKVGLNRESVLTSVWEEANGQVEARP